MADLVHTHLWGGWPYQTVHQFSMVTRFPVVPEAFAIELRKRLDGDIIGKGTKVTGVKGSGKLATTLMVEYYAADYRSGREHILEVANELEKDIEEAEIQERLLSIMGKEPVGYG